jgi:hypothetical protein
VVKAEDLDDDRDILDSKGEGDGCLKNVKIKYKKNLEHGMCKWTQALTCWREISNMYFNNPVHLKGHVLFYFFILMQFLSTELTVLSCDNCI